MSLRPDVLTWTGLLGKCVEFAQASLALPQDAEGERWRASVPSIVALQAVTFALHDLSALPVEEHAVARDRAAILVRDHVGQLEAIWGDTPMGETLLDVCTAARRALTLAKYAGAVELVWTGPGVLVMPDVHAGDVEGTLALMQPGTLVMPDEPVAWWVARPPITIAGCEPRVSSHPRQVYRQLDEDRITGDIVAGVESDLHAGLPLLVPLSEDGETIGHFTLDRETWEARQRAAMRTELIPVHHLECEDTPRLPTE